MLELDGSERILDLACATGRRTLELAREGYDAIGVDVCQNLLEVAGCEAEQQDLLPWFYEEDPRYISFEREFDVVLSLGGGALRALRLSPVAARASTVPIVEHLEHGESDDEGDDNDRLHPGFGVPQKQASTKQDDIEDEQRNVKVARDHR